MGQKGVKIWLCAFSGDQKAKGSQDGESCRDDLVLRTQNWKSETLVSISSTTGLIFKF